MKRIDCDIAIIGAGIVGIATAYYISKLQPKLSVILIDSAQPMALTSAQSGENYRNWWPHPIMTAFTDHSIDLMDAIANETDNLIQMSRRGYVLSTRTDDVSALMDELYRGYAELDDNAIRIHDTASSSSYQKPLSGEWKDAPSGVDVLNDQQLIKAAFPSYDTTVKTAVHIRRAGDISAQQMGQWMLDRFKQSGGRLICAEVESIDTNSGFVLRGTQGDLNCHAQQLVNAAGPFINNVAQMLGTDLPVSNVLQQKIAFEDVAGAIPRQMPFSIDLDAQKIDWDNEELSLLSESAEHKWLTHEMPGSIHCRPDGGEHGRWIKLGWAFNETSVQATRQPELLDSYSEIVLRGAARLNPSLKAYYGKLPRNRYHYGGYYTLTDENWPLIGEMDVKGAYVVGALSGFGTMAACAAGDLCARSMFDLQLPSFANALSLTRYADKTLMTELKSASQRGIL